MNTETVFLLRLAALLHDVGHTVFSHVSEPIAGRLPGLEQPQDLVPEGLRTEKCPSPSEALAILIVSSDSFKRLLECPELGADFIRDGDEASRKLIGFILGEIRPGQEFLAQLVNGAFDADKLDYMPRDALFAGVPCAVDIDRIGEKVTCVSDRKGEGGAERRLLSISSQAPRLMEELASMRSVLFEKVYYHPKARALEIQVRRMIESYMRRHRVRSACGLLRLGDDDVLADSGPDCEALRERRLLKPAVAIVGPGAQCKGTQAASWRRLRGDMLSKKFLPRVLRHATRVAKRAGLQPLRRGALAPDLDVPDNRRAGLEDHAFQGTASTGLRQIDGTMGGGRPESAKRIARHVAHLFCDERNRLSLMVAARAVIRDQYSLVLSEEEMECSKIPFQRVEEVESRLGMPVGGSRGAWKTRPAGATPRSVPTILRQPVSEISVDPPRSAAPLRRAG